MKISVLLKALTATALFVGPISLAQASVFDFSYTFTENDADGGNTANTGSIISGSFSGDLSGGAITNISNVSASLNGTPLVGSGSLYVFSYTAPGTDCSTCYKSGGAVISYNDPAVANNFVFVDTSTLTNYSNYFYVIPWPNGTGNLEATQYFSVNLGGNDYIDYYNGQYVAADFRVSAVPEPSIWAMMILGFSGLGFLTLRRTSRSVTIAA